jgi:hypothetical protein
MEESPHRPPRREASRTPAAEEGQDAEPASDRAGLRRSPRLGGGESEGDDVGEFFNGTKIYRKDVPPSSFLRDPRVQEAREGLLHDTDAVDTERNRRSGRFFCPLIQLENSNGLHRKTPFGHGST